MNCGRGAEECKRLGHLRRLLCRDLGHASGTTIVAMALTGGLVSPSWAKFLAQKGRLVPRMDNVHIAGYTKCVSKIVPSYVMQPY